MDKYQEQAEKFLADCGAKLTIEYADHDYYFDDDKEPRDIYNFKITRNGKQYSAQFGQSLANSGGSAGNVRNGNGQLIAPTHPDYKKWYKRRFPTAYDILACLTKSEPDTDMWAFAREYGYEVHEQEDYENLCKTYKAVCREWRGVKRLFGDVLEQLAEIA